MSSDCALYCFLCFPLFCVCYVLCCTDKVIKDVKPQSKGMFYTHWNKTLYLAFWWRQKMQFLILPHHVIRDLQGGTVTYLKTYNNFQTENDCCFKEIRATEDMWTVKCFWSSLRKWGGKFNHRSQRRERLTGVTWLTLLFCTNQTPTCFPCLLSSLASLVLIVEPNPSPLWSLECEIMCFTKYSGSVIVYTHYVMRWVATRLTAVPVLIIRLCLLQK